MERENIEKIKDRIAKLLRMAQDSSSPNEAAIAASRARSLMDKYQISEADLNDEIKDIFGKERCGRNYKNIPTFMSILAVAVARFNDCVVTVNYDANWQKTNAGGKASRCGPQCYRFIEFKGYQNDVVLAVAMMDSLVNCMAQLCKAYLTGLGVTGRYPRDLGEAFKKGCSHELVTRLNQLTRERNELMETEAKTSAGTALAIIDKKKRVEEQFGAQRTKRTRSIAAYDHATNHAHAAGAREGRKMQIQHHLGD